MITIRYVKHDPEWLERDFPQHNLNSAIIQGNKIYFISGMTGTKEETVYTLIDIEEYIEQMKKDTIVFYEETGAYCSVKRLEDIEKSMMEIKK